MRWQAITVLTVLMFARAHAAIPADDGPSRRSGVNTESVRWLRNGEFAELEKRAAEYRTSKARFTDGEWKLVTFYNGLGAPATTAPDEQWLERLRWSDAWIQARPESITARIARAKLLTRYGW